MDKTLATYSTAENPRALNQNSDTGALRALLQVWAAHGRGARDQWVVFLLCFVLLYFFFPVFLFLKLLLVVPFFFVGGAGSLGKDKFFLSVVVLSFPFKGV